MNSKELRSAQIDAGKRIKEIRKKLGLSQAELSRKSDVSCSLLCNYEKGRKTIGIDNFVKIANALGVSLDELYYGDKFISSITKTSAGERITNCFYELFSKKIIRTTVDIESGKQYLDIDFCKPSILKFATEVYASNNVLESKKQEYIKNVKHTTSLEIEAEIERCNNRKKSGLF